MFSLLASFKQVTTCLSMRVNLTELIVYRLQAPAKFCIESRKHLAELKGDKGSKSGMELQVEKAIEDHC